MRQVDTKPSTVRPPAEQSAAGRAAEIEIIRCAYRDACRGELRLLIIDGPPGCGERALLDAWSRTHRVGPVVEVDAARRGAVRTLAQRALSRLSPVRRARHPSRAVIEWSPGPAPVTELLALAEHRLRLREEVIRLVSELGAQNPAVVILHGLREASRDTLELLAALVTETRFAPQPVVLFVATVQGAPTGPVAQLLRSPAARGLTLGPLGRDGIRAFLSSHDVVDAVLSLTGGHPELIERLLCGDAIGGDTSPGCPQSCAALEALAVAAEAVEERTLEALSGPIDERALTRAGAVLRDDAWHLPSAQSASVRITLSEDRVRSLHEQLAELLPPERAARHALSAGRLDRAVELALTAADTLTRQGAPVEAAELLLEVAQAHPETPPALGRALVQCLFVAGDHADAIAHARVYASTEPEGQLLLGRVLHHAGLHAEALDTLEPLLDDLRADDRALIQTTIASARYNTGDCDGAEQLVSRLPADAAPAFALDALNTLGKVALARGDRARAEQLFADCLGRAEAAALARPASQALNNLAILAMGRGELKRAAALLERMLRLTTQGGMIYLRGLAHKNLAVVHQLQGAWQHALSHAERALPLFGGPGHAGLQARLSFNTADLYRSLGDPYRALRLCNYARQLAGAGLEDRVHAEGLRVEAAIYAELGDRNKSRPRWTEALALSLRLGEAGPANDARLGLAQLALANGDTARATALIEELGDKLDDARHAARAAVIRARLGRGTARVPLARCAVDAASATGDPLLVQVARLELARALFAVGSPDRAGDALATLREHERRLRERVPPALQELFAERSVMRDVASLQRELDEARTGRDARSTPEPPPQRVAAGLMVGDSPSMRALYRFVERVGPTESTVLIRGESGTGKELVADALHRSSARVHRPFVRVNCAALVDTLLLSELFGHERGAFTGADRAKPGRFEIADGGTILLDEIGDISPSMQAALLRVLQERTFERVGGTKTHRADVRVLAATHHDLAELVRQGRFREDLFYRLSGVTVIVPALRDRLDDLPALVQHLLAKIAGRDHTPKKVVAPDALARLSAHHWPGNVRELENVLRGAAVLSSGALLTAGDFAALGDPLTDPPPTVGGQASLSALMYQQVREGEGSIYEIRKRLERELIERALTDSGGNISKPAQVLGMKRPRLSKLVNEWGLK